MSVDATTATTATAEAASDEASFDSAVETALSAEDQAAINETMIEGMIAVGGQMLIMPRATDILKEAMSDE